MFPWRMTMVLAEAMSNWQQRTCRKLLSNSLIYNKEYRTLYSSQNIVIF
jgi:hypothetical protein